MGSDATTGNLPRPSECARLWSIRDDVVFLNHGSFGACPKAVIAAQQRYRDRMESDTMRFFVEDVEPLMDRSRAALGKFIGADPSCIAMFANVTEATNVIFKSQRFESGDELLVTDHEYPSCVRALQFVANRFGAKVVRAQLPWPVSGPDQVHAAIMRCVTDRTRLALLSHISSPTGLVLPIERLVGDLEARGVRTVVDGAHAVGMLDLKVQALGASFYVSNLHKWMFAPKGCAFLWVRPDLRDTLVPLVHSLHEKIPRKTRDPFRLDFDYQGTRDVTAWLVIPDIIGLFEREVAGGWAGLRAIQHDGAMAAQAMMCEALGTEPPVARESLGALAPVTLPDQPTIGRGRDALEWRLYDRWSIQAQVRVHPAAPHRLIRVSMALHNSLAQIEYLIGALKVELGRDAR